MKITPHFTYKELTHSDTAKAQGIGNTPDAFELSKLTTVCWKILEPARVKLGRPIKITSGFRSFALNRAVGSKDTSQHTKGEAVDIKCYDNIKLFQIISNLAFDQLIIEKPDENGYPSWLHVSYTLDRPNRNEVLVWDGSEYKKYKYWVGVNNLQSVYEV